MKKLLYLWVFILFSITLCLCRPISVFARASELERIIWLTEEYPPYNYQGADGLPSGLSVDILLEIWRKVGLKKDIRDIRFFPWARGYQLVMQKTNVCLFAMSITETRRELFQFIGPFKGNKIGIISKKTMKMRVDSLVDLGLMPVGVVREDIGDRLLIDSRHGMTLYRVTDGVSLIRMMEKGHLRVMAFGDIAAAWKMQKLGIDPANYEMVHILKEGYGGFAFNKNANRDMIARLQTAYDELDRNGKIEQIRNRYLSISSIKFNQTSETEQF